MDHTLTERWRKAVHPYLATPLHRLIAQVIAEHAEPHGVLRITQQRLTSFVRRAGGEEMMPLANPRSVPAALKTFDGLGFIRLGDRIIHLAEPAFFPEPVERVAKTGPDTATLTKVEDILSRTRGCRPHGLDSGWWVRAGDSFRWRCAPCNVKDGA